MIQIGDKVHTVYNDNIVTGVIHDMFNFERKTVYIVNIGGGILLKRTGEDITKFLEETEESKPDEITITREEFIRKGNEAITEAMKPPEGTELNSTVGIGVMISGVIVITELEKILFGEK